MGIDTKDHPMRQNSDFCSECTLFLRRFLLGGSTIGPESTQDAAREGYSEVIRDHIDEHCFNCRLFTTTAGYIGLGPRATIAGDNVCILLGYYAPVVLRRRLDHWRLKGDAYVHEIMFVSPANRDTWYVVS